MNKNLESTLAKIDEILKKYLKDNNRSFLTAEMMGFKNVYYFQANKNEFKFLLGDDAELKKTPYDVNVNKSAIDIELSAYNSTMSEHVQFFTKINAKEDAKNIIHTLKNAEADDFNYWGGLFIRPFIVQMNQINFYRLRDEKNIASGLELALKNDAVHKFAVVSPEFDIKTEGDKLAKEFFEKADVEQYATVCFLNNKYAKSVVVQRPNMAPALNTQVLNSGARLKIVPSEIMQVKTKTQGTYEVIALYVADLAYWNGVENILSSIDLDKQEITHDVWFDVHYCGYETQPIFALIRSTENIVFNRRVKN